MKRTLNMTLKEHRVENGQLRIIYTNGIGNSNPDRIENAFYAMVRELEEGNAISIVLHYQSTNRNREKDIIFVLKNQMEDPLGEGISLGSIGVHVLKKHVPLHTQAQPFRFNSQLDNARKKINPLYNSRKSLTLLRTLNGYEIQVLMENKIKDSEEPIERIKLTLNQKGATLMCNESLLRAMLLPFQGNQKTDMYSILIH